MQEPTIIYEDDFLIVVNKPAGLFVHSDGKNTAPTLVDWLLQKYPELKGVGEEQRLADGSVIDRPGIVHRLDADTSGLLVVARTQKAFDHLKEQFQERETRKVYRAFVHGALKEERGTINRAIGSGRGGRGPRSATRPHGVMREAVTTWRRIQNGDGVAYIEAFPKTGRTHQIRVHCAAIQHPLVGDTLYAPGRPEVLGFKRLALHALSLTFTHPGPKGAGKGGKELTFEAPLPPDFIAAEKALTKA